MMTIVNNNIDTRHHFGLISSNIYILYNQPGDYP